MTTRPRNLWLAALLSLALCAPCARGGDEPGDDKPGPKMKASTFGGLKLRGIGPAFMSGRISDIAMDPVNPNVWYVAAGSGGVWKTANAGTTWDPIFDDYGSYSIGCVAVDPNSRDTVWVGTGESVGGRHVGFGDGVYRSFDGGKSFENLGLKKTGHIAKILIDPRDSQVVYVAAQGPLWSSGGERGLYKTTDGGKTWKQVLAKGPWTGVTDAVFDPRNPDVIYAATHQRHRVVAALVNGGPESGIYKSTDGGGTWRQLKRGLPSEDTGKIALAVSPQNPDVVYATIELAGRKGGFWRSDDGGESWGKRSDYVSGGTGPHYYQEIWADPHREGVVYQADVNLHRTEDGGKTWASVEGDHKHTDNHAVAFHPTDREFVLVGCDGGLYLSNDYAKTWRFFDNLPLTQYYKVDVDYDAPFYHVVAGTQDNNTQYGPTRTGNNTGIRNGDWRITIGGDGHDCAIDPKDPDTIYCESQQGFLRRFDRRTGQSVDIRPQPGAGEEELRCNWDAPIIISPHSHTRLYFGSKKLHQSDDRGDSWRTISPDLSRNADRFQLKLMDRVWSFDALWDLYAMSQYGTISCVSESPLVEGLIYAGTDDGLIQVTEDGGRTWRKIDKFPGVPEYAFVNDVEADRHDPDTVYAAFDHHQAGDLKPYVLKSTDRGRTWKSIVGDLPDRHLVWKFIQDHEKKDLCFLGTEFGIYFTVNGGRNWIKLAGAPVIPFRDLEIQRRENDLVGASFGRSFYVLDDYTPLRTVSEELLAKNEFVLFPVRKALQYIPDRPLGGDKGSQGDAYFTAPNPPFGAVFTYYLHDTYKTREQLRREKEGKIAKEGGDTPYPGWDALRKEEREQKPALFFTVADAEGNVVARIDGPTTAGFHRVAWDLRYTGFPGATRNGPLVIPGTYTVRAAKLVDDKLTPLAEPVAFEVVSMGESTLPPQDKAKTLAFQKQVGELQNAVRAAADTLKDTLEELASIQKVLREARAPGALALFESARKLELQLLDAQIELTGDRLKTERSQMAMPSVLDRTQVALSGTLMQTYGPTQTHRREYAIAREEYAKLGRRLRDLIDTDFARLKQELDRAGIPWTAGRGIPLPDERR